MNEHLHGHPRGLGRPSGVSTRDGLPWEIPGAFRAPCSLIAHLRPAQVTAQWHSGVPGDRDFTSPGATRLHSRAFICSKAASQQ